MRRVHIGILCLRCPVDVYRGINLYRIHGIFILQIRLAGRQGIQILPIPQVLQGNADIEADILILLLYAGIHHKRLRDKANLL